MQNLKEKFDDYYNCHLLDKFAKLETERHKQLDIFVRRLLITGIVIPLIFILLWNNFGKGTINLSEDTATSKFVIYSLCFYFILTVAYCQSPILSFKLNVKADIMETFAAFWGNFVYCQGISLPDKTISASGIFPYYDSKEGDDFFLGYYRDTDVRICEEKLYKRVRNKNGSYNVTVFQGIAIQLKMKKNFQGQTVVLKDAGIFNIFKKSARRERIKLEDVIFEKEFEVFSDNQIEARYLLTPAFMERILQAKKAFCGKTIQFSFFDNKLLIAIETNQNMFEISSLFRRTTNRKMINCAFEQFSSVMNLIDALKLRSTS